MKIGRAAIDAHIRFVGAVGRWGGSLTWYERTPLLLQTQGEDERHASAEPGDGVRCEVEGIGSPEQSGASGGQPCTITGQGSLTGQI